MKHCVAFLSIPMPSLYCQSANARPEEIVISKKNCKDNWFTPMKKLPCGKQFHKDGNPEWDSQV